MVRLSFKSSVKERPPHQESNTFFENLLVPLNSSQGTIIVRQHWCEALNICNKVTNNSTYLCCHLTTAIKHAEFTLKATRAQASHTAMQFMELSENMKYLTSKHFGPKLCKPLDNIELCAILLCMVSWHWEFTYWSVSEAVDTNWDQLVDKVQQIKVEEAIEKEKGSQANMGNSPKQCASLQELY